MKRQARFTFVTDRGNRTATASLLAALECRYGDITGSIRLVTPKEVFGLEFGDSPTQHDVVCMSSMTPDFPRVSGLHRRLRELSGPDAFISICGGAHASGDPQAVLEAGFDYCCVGEGERVIQEVAERLEPQTDAPAIDSKEHGTNLGGIAGLFHLAAGRLVGKPRTDPLDLERFPALPVRSKFPTAIEIGRGCGWACAYCQTPAIHGNTERWRGPEAVAEIVGVYARFGMKDFRFLLPNALAYGRGRPGDPDCEALAALLDGVARQAGGGKIYLGSFPSEVRPDYVTAEAIGLLKTYVSNEKIVIGGESGSERMLDLIGRGHTVEDIERACDVVNRCGFRPWVDLMLGLPGEGADDRQATFGLITRLGKQGVRITMHFWMPLPGTALTGGRPTFLQEAQRRELDRLAQRGIVRGHWRRQEALTRRWVSQG
jgi:B12-binding domain/radical SAM domain protein